MNTTSILNADGTVNLQAALALKDAAGVELQRSLFRLRAAERAYDIEWKRNRFSVACGRAKQVLDAADAARAAARDAVHHADGVIREALNPESA